MDSQSTNGVLTVRNENSSGDNVKISPQLNGYSHHEQHAFKKMKTSDAATEDDIEVDRKKERDKILDAKKDATKPSLMDQDLEFYPIDEFNSSPSTFTAWDAFMTTNQAFFREPPCYSSSDYAVADSFSYMDVIPEEDDLSVLESDTDDTGSSVSTVIDKFSRTSTANSSFSERIRTLKDDPPLVTFDLEQVLSPFEQLEKELDGEDDNCNIVSSGPLVVVTSIVNAETEDQDEIVKVTESNLDKDFTDGETSDSTEIQDREIVDASIFENGSSQVIHVAVKETSTVIEKHRSKDTVFTNKAQKRGNISEKPSITITPPLPSRLSTKSNGKSKKDISEKCASTPSRKKDPYPTPTVPPRMSKHLPARRTRSDPGSSEPSTPSRIPRPTYVIKSNSEKTSATNSGSPRSVHTSKSKVPSPKMTTHKKIKLSDTTKSLEENGKSSIPLAQQQGISPENRNDTNAVKKSADVSPNSIILENHSKTDHAKETSENSHGSFDCDMSKNNITSIEVTSNELDQIKFSNESYAETTYSASQEEETSALLKSGKEISDSQTSIANDEGHVVPSVDDKSISEEMQRSHIIPESTPTLKEAVVPKQMSIPKIEIVRDDPQHTDCQNDPGHDVGESNLQETMIEIHEDTVSKAFHDPVKDQFRYIENENVFQANATAEFSSNEDLSFENLPENIQTISVTTYNESTHTSKVQQQIINEPVISNADMKVYIKSLVTEQDHLSNGTCPNLKENEFSNVETAKDQDDGIGQQQRPIKDILQALDNLCLSSAPQEVEINVDWNKVSKTDVNETDVPVSELIPSLEENNLSEETDALTTSEKSLEKLDAILKDVRATPVVSKVGESQQTTQYQEPLPASVESAFVKQGSAVSVLELRHQEKKQEERGKEPPPQILPPSTEKGEKIENVEDEPVKDRREGDHADAKGHCRYEKGQRPSRDTGSQSFDVISHDFAMDMLNKLGKKGISDEEALVSGHSYEPRTINSDEFQQIYASGIVFYPLGNGHTGSGEAEDLASTRHSSGCDDSGVFLEDLPYTPESITTTIVVPLESQAQVHHVDDFTNSKHLSPEMRQYSIDAQGLDSDAEKSDDLGLASSSVDSADDLDGDPLPSTLKIEPLSPSKKKPPPIPPRKSVGNGGQYVSQKELILTTNTSIPYAEVTTATTTPSTPLVSSVNSIENEAMPSENFINTTRKHSEGFKWKSEECLRSAVDNKWFQKHGPKSISVKDRIAMFSEMETTPVVPSNKKEVCLHRYPSENNVKSLSSAETCERKDEATPKDNTKIPEDFPSLNRDTKWYSMYSLPLTSTTSVPDTKTESTDLKTACCISSLTTNGKILENMNRFPGNDSSNGTAILKVDTDTYQRYSEKPIISSYPQTQLANNKRYNYGRYSLNPIRTTDDLLTKKNSGLLSIIDSRKQPLAKLKGLVIPDRPLQSPTSKTLPTIVSNDSLILNSKTDVDIEKDCKRSMLSAASYKTMSLPRTRNEMKAKLEPVSYDVSKLMSEPPWKSNVISNKSNVLPKYSPAFKARTALDLPSTVTSSLSPTPPSSITSPLSPPPSSPSSICSSNASSATSVATMQQNIFQFSLSHSKPVTPILPEKPIMSPPSLPSDIEYEGDNSEDSSTSASPMAAKLASSRLGNTALSTSLSALRYEKPTEFTSNGQIRSESLGYNDSDGNDNYDGGKPSSHDARPMNHSFVQEKIGTTDRQARQHFLSSVNKSANSDYKMNDKFQDSCHDLVNGKSDYRETTNSSNIITPSSAPPVADTNDIYSGRKNIFSATSQEVQAVKFRAQPLTLNQVVKNGTYENSSKPLVTKTSSNEDPSKIADHRNGYDIDDTKSIKDVTEYGYDKHPWSRSTDLIRYKNKLDSEEDEDDSHSSLSHQTEDSRPTTDDYFSDATTDSFDKSFDPDLKPRRLSQQKVVLKAAVEGTDSVQKFKALAEKWEQRTDAKSPPPPPPPVVPAPRKENKPYSGSVPIASSFLSSVINITSNFPSNGGNNAPLINASLKLPPSLMPRNKSHTDIKNVTQNPKTLNHSQNQTSGSDQKRGSNLYGKDSKIPYESVWVEDRSRRSSINGYRDHSDSGSSTDTGSNYHRKKPTEYEFENIETNKAKERTFSNGSLIEREDFIPAKADPNTNSSQSQKMENEVFVSEDDAIFCEKKISGNERNFSHKSPADVLKDKNGTIILLKDNSDSSNVRKLCGTDDQVQTNESSPDYLRKRLHSDGKSLPDTSWKSESTLDLTTRRNSGREFQSSDFLTARTLSKSQVSLRDPLESVRSHGSSLFSSKNAKSISVSDIRKAFETQTMQNQVLSTKPPPLPPRNSDVSPKIVYRKTSSHRISSTDHNRLSSFDSTTSGDSDPVSPVRCGSVGSLTSISRDPYGSVTSLASTTSLISPQELQQLIDEANQSLDEDTKDPLNQEIQVIVLHREVPSGSIGITLAGGADYEIKEITVHKVISGSLADRDGRLRKGDRVISINGRMLKGTTHREALDILKAPRPEVVLVIAREKTETNGQSNGLHHNHLNGDTKKVQMDKPSAGAKEYIRKMRDASSLSSKGSLDETSTMNIVCVHLQKDAAGLGFSLEGGKGSPQGDRPLLIKRIFKGGVADKDGKLQVGDEIISVNGQSVTSMTRTEAWNFLKKLPEEPILLRARQQVTCSS